MQKSNDNEIVQYLGVKHIINYLGVQVGLTQTLHFRRLLAILCLGHMEWGGGGGSVNCVCLKQFVYLHAHICLRLCVSGGAYVCVRVCIYANIWAWVLEGG